ncbi:MAG: hypothetical protein Ct9H300mP11_32330 [Chloroflexota bacterium]|nr:MAG: hypothetical protein Ct9H300mP11_32330 [Chloroflexota bacterium]
MSTVAGNGERGYEGDGGQALAATWGSPKGIRCDAQDNVVVVDTENHAIRRNDTLLGSCHDAGGRLGGDGDGGSPLMLPWTAPRMRIDDQGNIFIADSNNHPVRVVGALITGQQVIFSPS